MTERSEKMNRWSTFKLGQDVNVLVAGTIVGRVRGTGMYVVATTDGRETEVHPYDLRFDPDGRFDPANAGFGAPEAPLPTWDEAVAHAEVLREQGVKVRIDKDRRRIEFRGTNGKLHDPDDGTPAYRMFYLDGTPEWIEHWTNGKLVSAESFPPPIGEA